MAHEFIAKNGIRTGLAYAPPVEGSISIPNGSYLYGTNQLGTGIISLIGADSSNIVHLGDSGRTLTIDATSSTFTNQVTVSYLVSTVATGTAPIQVTSTTLCSNLNSQYLNGQASTYYLNATNISSGTLVVARGGTGASTLTSKGILYGNGTSAVGITAAGSAGQLLTSLGGGSNNPTWTTYLTVSNTTGAIQWANTASSATLTQADATAGAGTTLTVRAQSATASGQAAGDLHLHAGDSTYTTSGDGGNVEVTAGNSAGATSTAGGSITVTAGSSTGTGGTGGGITLSTGTGAGSTYGEVLINRGPTAVIATSSTKLTLGAEAIPPAFPALQGILVTNTTSAATAVRATAAGVLTATASDTYAFTSGALGVALGGTGATTLTGVLIGNGTSAVTAVAQLGISQGGTNTNSFSTSNALVLYNGTSLASLTGGTGATAGQALLSGGTGNEPNWGTLGTGAGGTGLTSFTAYGVFYASSTSAIGQVTEASTTGKFLLSTASNAPTWSGNLTFANSSGLFTLASGATGGAGLTQTAGTVAGNALTFTSQGTSGTNYTAGTLSLTGGNATGTGASARGAHVNITAGSATNTGAYANTGGTVTIAAGAAGGTTGTGGSVTITAGNATNAGAYTNTGGSVTITAGQGRGTTGGTGGAVSITAGGGGTTVTGGAVTITGGAGTATSGGVTLDTGSTGTVGEVTIQRAGTAVFQTSASAVTLGSGTTIIPAFAATGTGAPFTVSATGTVTNLSADLLDGQQGSYYLDPANLSSTVGIAKGGTNATSFDTTNALVLYNGTSLVTIAAGTGATAGQALLSGGSGAVPTWGSLTVSGGGTGLATITAHALLIGNGTNNVNLTSVGGLGTILIGKGASADPTWLAAGTSGNLLVSAGNSADVAWSTNLTFTGSTGAFLLNAACTAPGLSQSNITNASGRTLTIQSQTTTFATGTGGTLALAAGAGSTTGAGGQVTVTGGAGGATGAGGAITITTGAGGATSGNSGTLSLKTGTAPGGTVGEVQIYRGATQVVTTSSAGLSLQNSLTLTNVPDPTNNLDAANKQWVLSQISTVVQGLDVKASCRLATTANIASWPPSTLVAIDGITPVAGDRILVKNQSTGSQNGIWVAANGTAWARATDADVGDITAGMFTWVTEGTTQAKTGWYLTTPDPITVGTTSLTYTQFSYSTAISAGTGLSLDPSTLVMTASFGNTSTTVAEGDHTHSGGANMGVQLDPTNCFQASKYLPVANGGTGVGTLTTNGVLLGNGTSAVTATTAGTAGQPLLSGGAGVAPNWGILGTAYGGTGATTVTDWGVAYYDATNTQYNFTAAGAVGSILIGKGASAAPVWLGGSTAGRILVTNSTTGDPAWVAPTAGTGLTISATASAHTYGIDTALVNAPRRVRVASTANIDLTTGTLLTIDGVTLSTNDRVLVKNQTTASQNGIYLAAAGAWTRATDANGTGEIYPGMIVIPTEGATQSLAQFVVTNTTNPTINTTAINFTTVGKPTDDPFSVVGSGTPTPQDISGQYLVPTSGVLVLRAFIVSKDTVTAGNPMDAWIVKVCATADSAGAVTVQTVVKEVLYNANGGDVSVVTGTNYIKFQGTQEVNPTKWRVRADWIADALV